jgi:hypothetical protein
VNETTKSGRMRLVADALGFGRGQRVRMMVTLLLPVLLAACGGSGSSDGTGAAASHTVSVTVTGLRHSYNGMTLRNNGGDDLRLFGDGSFTFKTAVASGSPTR